MSFRRGNPHILSVILFVVLFILPTAPVRVPAQSAVDEIAAEERSSAGAVRLRRIVTGLDHPWAIAPLPDGALLVSERPGTLFYVSALPRRIHEVRGIPDVYRQGQGGLLDVVPSDRFSADQMIYFTFAEDARGGAVTAVGRGRLRVDREGAGIGAVFLDGVETVFRLNRVVRGGRHFGSRLAWGDDGYLYLTIGDRGEPDEAQDATNHQGSVVRITRDGSIPPGNPSSVRDPETGRIVTPAPGLYSWGHRNAQGIARNPVTGEIWLHEHGPRGGDEINIVTAGGNYGWPRVTHGIAYSGREITEYDSREGYVDPVLHWTPSIAPSGFAFLGGGSGADRESREGGSYGAGGTATGTSVPEWEGDILVGALAGRHLRRVDLSRDGRVLGEEVLFAGFARFRDVRVGPDGTIYVVTDESPDGGVYILEEASR
jgi:glucose/arabinose dehydrogenase